MDQANIRYGASKYKVYGPSRDSAITCYVYHTLLERNALLIWKLTSRHRLIAWRLARRLVGYHRNCVAQLSYETPTYILST